MSTPNVDEPTKTSRDGGFNLRNPIDFSVVSIYLQEGGIQTRSDGASGFYYYAGDRDNGLRFVPSLKTVKPYAHYLRKRLPFYEGDLEKLKSEVATIQEKLDDPDFDDIVQRQSLTNKMGTLELHIKSQFKEWEKKAQELDEEEEKGTLTYYSTRDTDGVVVDEDKIFLENPKISDELMENEAILVQEEKTQIELDEYATPAADCGVFTDDHAADCRKIAEIKKKWAQEKIERVRQLDATKPLFILFLLQPPLTFRHSIFCINYFFSKSAVTFTICQVHGKYTLLCYCIYSFFKVEINELLNCCVFLLFF